MIDDKYAELTQKYPKFFHVPDADKVPKYRQSVRCCCETGWYNLINTACRLINWHIESKSSSNVNLLEFRWAQIKEKFGGLRMYAENSDDFISGVIAAVEALSLTTCEVCGKPGLPGTASAAGFAGGWIKTLCPDCRASE